MARWRLRTMLARLVPAAIGRPLVPAAPGQSPGKYDTIRVSEADVQSDAYKRHFGGGRDSWEARGRFQLVLLQRFGLMPEHRLLDVGCGPARAAMHIVDYLQAGRYCGIDYNQDFVRIARGVTATQGLTAKAPRFEVAATSDLLSLNARYDYVWVFSVLNHCHRQHRTDFLGNVGAILNPGAAVLVSHSRWFDPSYLRGTALVGEVLSADAPEFADLSVADWGWENGETIFPLLRLRCRPRV